MFVYVYQRHYSRSLNESSVSLIDNAEDLLEKYMLMVYSAYGRTGENKRNN